MVCHLQDKSKDRRASTCQGYSPEAVSSTPSVLLDILVFGTPQSK